MISILFVFVYVLLGVIERNLLLLHELCDLALRLNLLLRASRACHWFTTLLVVPDERYLSS